MRLLQGKWWYGYSNIIVSFYIVCEIIDEFVDFTELVSLFHSTKFLDRRWSPKISFFHSELGKEK